MTFIRKGGSYPYDLDRLAPLVQRPNLTNVGSQDASVTSLVDASSTTLPQQHSASQPLTTGASGTVSDLDKLFSKLIPSASPALQEIDPGDPFCVWLFYLYICFVHI